MEVFIALACLCLFWFIFRSKRLSRQKQTRWDQPHPQQEPIPPRWDHSARTPQSHTSPISVGATPQSVTLKGRCWVIDGDTIVIDKVHIRLTGIDAPELDHPWSQKAKFALVGLCKGQTITAITDGTQSHDRTVAQCFLPDGRDLSAEMVKSGHAIDWAKHSEGRYRHLEVPGIRQKLWRATLRQQGRMPPKPL